MTCSAPKRFLVVAEREPDDMFRSQTDVSDRREVQGVIACQDREGRPCKPRGPLLATKTPPFVMWGGRVGGGLAGEDRYSGGANPQFWARRIHCPVA